MVSMRSRGWTKDHVTRGYDQEIASFKPDSTSRDSNDRPMSFKCLSFGLSSHPGFPKTSHAMASLMSDVLKGVSDKKLIIPVSFPVLIQAVPDHSIGEEKSQNSVDRGPAMADVVAVRGGVDGLESAFVSSIQID